MCADKLTKSPKNPKYKPLFPVGYDFIASGINDWREYVAKIYDWKPEQVLPAKSGPQLAEYFRKKEVRDIATSGCGILLYSSIVLYSITLRTLRILPKLLRNWDAKLPSQVLLNCCELTSTLTKRNEKGWSQ